MVEYQADHWITESQAKDIGYADYWCNAGTEKDKIWNVIDGNFKKMEDYLYESFTVQHLAACIAILKNTFNRKLEGVGIDLAAGNLWAAPHLLKDSWVKKLYCLEYSKYRLFTIGPKVLEHYKVPKEKVVLVYGSFYDLHLPDNSLDFAFLSAAFHHADNPDLLLNEIKRVLKPSGVIIIIGECPVSYAKAFLKHMAKFIISKTISVKAQQKIFKRTFAVKKDTLIPTNIDFIAPEQELGDHYYVLAFYKSLFRKYNFTYKIIRVSRSVHQSFLLINNK